MTPEETINHEVWKVLQRLKEESLVAEDDGSFFYDITHTVIAAGEVNLTRERKRAIVRNILCRQENALGIIREVGSSGGRFGFYLRLVHPKFDEVYRLYESGIDYQSNGKRQLTITPSIPPIIKPKALELISREIGDLDSGTNLINFLVDCGVDRKLIEYPQTKWRMVNSVLQTLATSSIPKDQETLFKIIGEASHPLMHNGDAEGAKRVENKFNNLLEYDNLVLKKGRLTKIDEQIEQDDEEEDDENDCFNYDGGISSPYENTDLELFILKKILLEHKQRGSGGFFAKELSFSNASLEGICRVINKLIEDKILYLSVNTRPEVFEKEGIEGIEDKHGFINWGLVEKLDKNSQEMDKESGCVIFDTDVIDEVKLKGRIDIAIEEFMNDKIYTPLGRIMDRAEVDEVLAHIEHEPDKKKKSIREALIPKIIPYLYYKQREIVIDKIIKDNKEEMMIDLNNFQDKQVDVLKTLMALEKENLLRIRELGSSQIYNEKGEFIGRWSIHDKPFAKIQVLKIHSRKQEPTHIIIDNEVGIRGIETLARAEKRDKNKFPHKLPAGTIWENFTIKFLDDENVFIQVKQLKHNTNYKEMGLVGKGNNPNPSELWAFLKVLAGRNGELTFKDPQARDKYKKQKELLAKSLQSYFSLDYDPFYPYRSSSEKSGNSYKIKITLIPPLDQNKGEVINKDEDALGIKNYLDEQNPQVYEDK